MSSEKSEVGLIFARWTNALPLYIALVVPIAGAAVVGAIWYWFAPAYTDAGYQPTQPVLFSHKIHAGELGLDCRYCHNTVERAARSAIPPTATCMGCHERLVLPDSVKLAPVRISAATGKPIEWVRVHMLPDYAFFDHSAHLAAGVGCTSCHDRIDQMDVVFQAKPLSMGWCLQCHRAPQDQLRPLDRVTDMSYDPQQANYDADRDPQRKRHVRPPVHCSGCHR